MSSIMQLRRQKAHSTRNRVSKKACCIDHFFWFDKSTRRKGGMEKYAEFCDTEYKGFIKHINVRWLSLQMAVERMLKLYPLTRAYFLLSLNDARFVRIQQLYEDPMYEVYLLYQAAFPAFTTFTSAYRGRRPRFMHYCTWADA